MSLVLARAHILGEQRLRGRAAAAVEAVWRSLPGHDRENVDEFLSRVLPVVNAAQRQSVALTEAYLARSIGRQPLGISPARVVNETRPGSTPAEVYERPFVTLWSKLGEGVLFEQAMSAATARAGAAAATDVQLAMRQTLVDVGEADDAIQGYERVPDGEACEFCVLVSGQRYTTADLMPIHNHCGCGVDVLTDPFEPTTPPDGVAINDHGELGPVLGDPAHDFTDL